jgi:hypothetical protein
LDDTGVENFSSICSPAKQLEQLLYRLFRKLLKEVKPILADVDRRSLRHCLVRRAYKESIGTNMRNFVEQGYLPRQLAGL